LDGTLIDTDALHKECYREAGVSLEQLDEQIRQGTLQVSPEIKAKKNEKNIHMFLLSKLFMGCEYISKYANLISITLVSN
jgi:hypothetical protein